MVDSKSKLFQGAGVVVCKPGDAKSERRAVIVESVHADQVSDLFFSFKEIFASNLDYFNKFEFYGRLADAANCALANAGELSVIREAIIAEACSMANEMDAHLYFAYGSNMDTDQMSYRCPKALFAGTATLRGYGFELDSAGVATIAENPGSQVHGALWLIAESDERKLDSYEGVESGCYRKAMREVISDTGSKVSALVYISNRDVHDGATYRSGYMDNIIRNARLLGFDAGYIDDLEAK